MGEIRTVTTLKRKAAQIAASIKLNESQIWQARRRTWRKLRRS
jgi:hypothetical protein